jgi:hypothetical protein
MILFDATPQSPDFWTNPAWTAIGVGVAILFGIVGIILWIFERRKSEKRKEITFQILSDTPIASINQAVKDQVELRFQGKKVEDLHLVVLKLRNVGNVAIEKTDFVEPIKFEFPGRKYLTGEVLSCEPEEVLNVKERNEFFKPGLEDVLLAPVLFNSTDEMTLKLLITGQGKIKGTARIIGGKLAEIDLNSQHPTIKISKALAFFASLLGVFMLIFAFFVGWALLALLMEKPFPSDTSILISSIIIIIIWFFYRIYRSRKAISQKLSQIRGKGIRIIW